MPYITLPDNTSFPVLDGETPEAAWEAAKQKYPQAFGIAPKTGFGANLKAATRQMGRDIGVGVTAPFIGDETTRGAINANQAQADSENVKAVSWDDVKNKFAGEGTGAGIASLGGYLRDSTAQSLPYLAPTIAGARLGAMAGAAIGGVGAIPGAIIGGVAGGIPAFAGQNIQERVNNPEFKGDLVTPEVYGVAAGQAALDAGGGALALGKGIVGKIIGKDLSTLGSAAARKAVEGELLSVAKRSLAGAALRQGAKGAAYEIPTEIAQQVLQREQADEALLSDEALSQYAGLAVAAGGMGGIMGGAGGVQQRMQGKRLEQAQAAQDKANAAALKRSETIRAKQDNIVGAAQQAAANTFINEQITTGQPSREEQLRVALTGMLQTQQGVQDVIKNPANYFPGYSQAEIKTIKKDLLSLRDNLKAEEKNAPKVAAAEQRATKQADLEAAFPPVATPEPASNVDNTYTPEALKQLGIPQRSQEYREALGHPIGHPDAVTSIDNFAKRTANPKAAEAITQHLDSIKQTTPQENSNGQNNDNAGANINSGVVPTGAQPSVGNNDVGTGMQPSSTGQVDEGAVGPTSGSVATDVGRAEQEYAPLNYETLNDEYKSTTNAVNRYKDAGDDQVTKDNALAYIMHTEQLNDSNGGHANTEAHAKAQRFLEQISEAEKAKVQPMVDKWRDANSNIAFNAKRVEASSTANDDLKALRKKARVQDFIQHDQDMQDAWNDLPKDKQAELAKRTEAVLAVQQMQASKKLQQLIDKYGNALSPEQETALAAEKQQLHQDLKTQQEAIVRQATDKAIKEYEGMASQSGKVANSETVDSVNKGIAKVLHNKFWNSNRIHVVQSVEDLPPKQQKLFGQFEHAQAATFNGQEAWFIADRMDAGTAAGVFMHEVGVHMGMRRLLGAERIKNLANRILDMVDNEGDASAEIARNAITRAQQAKVLGNYEELVAYFVEEAHKAQTKQALPKRVIAWLKEFFNGYRKALNKLHMNPEGLSGEDIVALAKGAAGLELKHEKEVSANSAPTANASENIKTIDYEDEVTEDELAALQKEANDEYHYQVEQVPDKFIDRLLLVLGKPPGVNTKGWLANGWISTGATFTAKEQALHGNYGTLNGLELGAPAHQRSLNGRNLIENVLQFGKLVFDQYAVPQRVESEYTVPKLAQTIHSLHDALANDGMSEEDIYDAKYHMFYADRYKEAKKGGWAVTHEFSQKDIDRADQLKAQYPDEWNAINEVHQGLRAQTIDAMVQSGAWTADKAKLYLDRVEYIPFSREAKEHIMNNGRTTVSGLMSGRTEFPIKGSEESIKDPLTNIINSQEWMLGWAIKNNAARLIANSMVDMHQQTDGAQGGKWVPAPEKGKLDMKIFVNGEPKYLRVIDPNDAAIFIGHPTLGMGGMRIFHTVTGLLRKGVTLAPSFHFRQLVEDPLRATFISGNKAGYAKTLTEAWTQFGKNIVGETPEAEQLRSYGGAGQRDYHDTHQNAIRKLKGEEFSKAFKAYEFMEGIAQANDLSTRAAVFKEAIKEALAEGKSEKEAANIASYKAMLLINFNDRGNFKTMTALMNMVPFVNARIQGDSRMWKALIGKNVSGLTKEQAQKMMLVRMSNLAAFTMMYALARGGDDDYENAEQTTRDGNFLFNIGGMPMKFPVPPELGAIKTGVEQAVRYASGNENSDDKKIITAVNNAWLSLIFGPTDFTPTLVKPLIENVTNHSFFTGRELVGQYQQNLPVNQRSNPQTSAMAIGISNLLQNLPEPLQVSPIKIDNLLRGWLGTAGSALASASDIMFADKPEMRANQTPGFGGMFYNPEGGGIKSDFYELFDAATKAKAGLNNLKKNGTPEQVREFIEENRKMLSMYPKLNSIKTQLDAQRARVNAERRNLKVGSATPEDATELQAQVYQNEMRILKSVHKLRAEAGY